MRQRSSCDSRDASWELAPNAFSELLERPNECEAEACLCPKGKKHVAADLTANNTSSVLIVNGVEDLINSDIPKKNLEKDRRVIEGGREVSNPRASSLACSLESLRDLLWVLRRKWSLLLCNLCGSMAVHRGCANLCEADAFFECESCTITSYEDAAVGDQAGTSKNKIHGSAKRGKKKRGVSWKNGISTKVKKKEYQQGNNRIQEPAALMVQEESSRSHSDDDDDEDVIVVVDDDDDDDDVVLVNYIPSQPSVRIAAQQEDNLILTMDGSSISVLKLEQRPDAPDALRDVRVVGDVNVRAISPPRTARTKHFVEVAGIPQEPQAIVLYGSHSLLRSSDRIKPRSGDWVVTIDFLQEAANTSLSSGSNACEIMPVIQNVHSLASGASPWNTQPTPPAPQQQMWNSDFSEARPWVGPSAYKQPPVETTKLQQNIDSSASLKTSLDLLFHMGDTSSPLQRISLKPGTNMVDIMRGLRCCVVDSNGVIVQSDALLTPQEVMSSDSTNTTAFSQLSSGCNNNESSSVVIKQPNETTTTQDINQQWVNSSLVTLAPSHPGLPNYSDQSLHFHSNAKKGRTNQPLYCLDRTTVHVVEAVCDEYTSIHSAKENSASIGSHDGHYPFNLHAPMGSPCFSHWTRPGSSGGANKSLVAANVITLLIPPQSPFTSHRDFTLPGLYPTSHRDFTLPGLYPTSHHDFTLPGLYPTSHHDFTLPGLYPTSHRDFTLLGLYPTSHHDFTLPGLYPTSHHDSRCRNTLAYLFPTHACLTTTSPPSGHQQHQPVTLKSKGWMTKYLNIDVLYP
uniref:PHF7/G2E3-like PHD zinc finger domain-containing protein n=1 Tax=Timema genevievae TaxID=629358 RepID=A0A7R9PGV4_TIMGE|nr:unnamed protein product [Timema genevievae]